MEGQGDLGYELRVGSRVTVGHKQGNNEQEKRERERGAWEETKKPASKIVG